jgi:chromosome segregation ATPase
MTSQFESRRDDAETVLQEYQSRIIEARAEGNRVEEAAKARASRVIADATAKVAGKTRELDKVNKQIDAANKELDSVNNSIAEAKAKAKALFQGIGD